MLWVTVNEENWTVSEWVSEGVDLCDTLLLRTHNVLYASITQTIRFE